MTSTHRQETTANLTVVERAKGAFTPISFAIGVLIVGAALVMWPAQYGGWSTVVIVSGESMQPTYDTGDLVFSWDTGAPGVDDVIVFQVPEGQAGEGGLVLHRLLARDGTTLVTQGDNNAFRDPWQLTDDDVLGTALFHLPNVGHLFFALGSPFTLAWLLGLAAVAVLWPRRGPECDETDNSPTD